MQQIEISFAIYSKFVMKNAFNEYKKLVNSKLQIDSDKAIITFYTDDIYITKEFSNYMIALSAIEV